MANKREELITKVKQALANPATSEKLWGAMTRARDSRAAAVEELHVDIRKMKEANRACAFGSCSPNLDSTSRR